MVERKWYERLEQPNFLRFSNLAEEFNKRQGLP
jgi:hypothetical protein